MSTLNPLIYDEKKLMVCTECQSLIPEASKYCPYCGIQLKVIKNLSASEGSNEKKYKDKTTIEKHGKTGIQKANIYFLIGVIGFLSTIILIFINAQKMNEGKIQIPIESSDLEGSNTDAQYKVLEEPGIEKETIGSITATWRLYDDHAELLQLVSYYQYDEFEIPSEHKNLPVTVLGSKDVNELDIDSIFIKKLLIPGSIQDIRSNFFTLFDGLERIEVSEDNTEYKSVEGVVYSADGTVLIMYPREKSDSQNNIIEGTKKIGEAAFQFCSNITKVVFPDSLIEVDTNAFDWCENLSAIEFNDGLEKIGDFGFSGTPLKKVVFPPSIKTIGTSAFELKEGFDEIILPDSLNYMGLGAFYTINTQFRQESLKIPQHLMFNPLSISGVLVAKFEVDENNQYHSVKDGVLFNKNGKKLIAVPGQCEGRFDVPEGVKSIEYGAFDNCLLLTDVYLPSSVEELGDDLGVGTYGNRALYTVHCYEGTEAQKRLDEIGVQWVKIE